MNLAIFDVDGTLLQNQTAEDACYGAALRDTLGLSGLDIAWESYEHVSDTGIAVEAFRRQFGAAPTARQLDATSAAFVALLKTAQGIDASAIVATAGTLPLFSMLTARGWAVAIATGAWRVAAEFKLAAAGLDTTGIPMATSEDGPARNAIVTCAATRAARHHHVETFSRVVSIGDGVWDVETARALGLPFVGIGTGAGAERLERAGAGCVLPDFLDLVRTQIALETATVPADSPLRHTEHDGVPRTMNRLA